MIARLIDICLANRVMVVLLTGVLALAGAWATRHVKVDAIPDLSDVQVVIRTDYPGQAPKIVEDQVTYPLTTAMLAVPYAETVRGYSMFGTSFVYVLFEDGTDLYWARSRVLEQLSVVSGKLPTGVAPELGPDATGVGWVYEYVLTTGRYCQDHPQGLWHDPEEDRWYAEADRAGLEPDVRRRLVHRRVFPERRAVWVDPRTERRYGDLSSVPAEALARVRELVIEAGVERCPVDGRELTRSDVDLAGLRSLQDWYLRYELTAIDGISEVASAGGFVKQYQVVVDPVKLAAHALPIQAVEKALRRSNVDVGGSLVERSEAEFMVRGVGLLGSLSEDELAAARAAGRSVEALRTQRVLDELGHVALDATPDGFPVYLADVAELRVGPEIRRGVLDWNGEGETVGGILVMRFGENARRVIERVQAKLDELEQGLPPGVAIETAYDRSDLIDRSIHTLTDTLLEEITVVALVCILFLLHARSELVAVFVVPTGVLVSILIMHLVGINANIMSLGGIAIAIGVMVDSSIVMVENAHKHLDREEERLRAAQAAGRSAEPRPRIAIIGEAAREVGPSLFFSLLIITVSFVPVFALGEQSGRLFKPLAFTKTFAMASSAFLAVTIIPVLMSLFITERVLPARWGWRVNLAVTLAAVVLPPLAVLALPLPLEPGTRRWLALGLALLAAMLLVPQRIVHEHRSPISRVLQRLYQPFFELVMHHRGSVLVIAAGLTLSTLWPLRRLGAEFMPPLEEGDLLYMPTTDPGISMTKARELLQQTDRMIREFPEVATVLGKAGRADTATDPAPPSMFETTIVLRRDRDLWRRVPVPRFFEDWPEPIAGALERLWPTSRPITLDELVHGYEWPDGTHVPGMNEVIGVPGLTNSWTMPIRTRIDMLSTGIKTPVGIKVLGPDLRELSRLAGEVAQALQTGPDTGSHTVSAFSEKTVGGNYVDVRIDREEAARYALQVGDVQDVITSAMGGMNVTWTVEGLERYPVNVRYPHELRDDLDALRQTLVATPAGAQVPLGQLASIETHKGPPMIKSENARLTSWVFVDIAGIDVGTYVERAQETVAASVTLPAGYSLVWSGQFEYMQAARARLMVIVPVALVLIVLLLYGATHSWLRVAIVLLAVPFSLVGAIWFLYLLDYHLSLAVWVGVIALAGLDAETGLVMLLYLDNSYDRYRAEGRMRDPNDLWHAVHDGAVKRIRPKTMTVVTTFIGLVPLMWASGAGADTMRRLAAPMLGGLTTSFLMELLVYPVLFYTARSLALRREWRHGPAGASPAARAGS